jgi:hypothetical protein
MPLDQPDLTPTFPGPTTQPSNPQLTYTGSVDHDIPEQMPEIARELTIVKGAFASLQIRTEELITKLTPALRPDTPHDGVALKEGFEVRTPVGQELHELQHMISKLEDRVASAGFRLEL